MLFQVNKMCASVRFRTHNQNFGFSASIAVYFFLNLLVLRNLLVEMYYLSLYLLLEIESS